MRTAEQVRKEVLEILNTKQWLQTVLQALQSKGYTIRYTWIKTSAIGTVTYIKRSNIYRVQVSEPELVGKYFKAYIAEIPTGITINKNNSILIQN